MVSHCKRGHEMTAANTYIYTSGRPRRECRVCRDLRSKEWVARHRERSRATKLRYYYRHHEKNLAASQDYYRRNAEQHKATCRRLREEHRKRVYRILGKAQCSACRGTSRLEFHHRNPKAKLFEIGSTRSLYRPLAELKREAKKCIVLCRKCHMSQHRRRKAA